MQNPLVSVIVPAYNVTLSVEKCLDSIYAQTYENIEIIVVNDGSTDSTMQVLDGFRKSHIDLTIISQSNQGLSGARNTGLNFATGEYIFFLDSDDYLGSQEIELLINRAIETDADMVVGGMTYVNPSGDVLRRVCEPSGHFDKRSYWSRVYRNAEGTSVEYIVSCGKLYKARLFDCLRFSLGKIHEDEFIIHRLVSQCDSIEVVQSDQLFYVQNENSITHKPSAKSKLDVVEAFLLRNSFFFKEKYYDLFWASLCQAKAALVSAADSLVVEEDYRRWKKLKREWKESFRVGCKIIDLRNRHCISSMAFYLFSKILTSIPR